MKSFRIFLLALSSVALCQTASADLLINLARNGEILDSRTDGRPVISVIGGDSVEFEVVITQQGTFFIPSINLNAPDYRLSPSDPLGNGEIATGLGLFEMEFVASRSALEAGGDLSFSVTSFGDGFIDLNSDGNVFAGAGDSDGDLGNIDPVFAAQPQRGSDAERGSVRDNSVSVGTITIDVADGATGVYDVDFNQINGISFAIGNQNGLGTATNVIGGGIRLAVVPEPSSTAVLAIFGLTSAAVARRRRNRRRIAKGE